MALLRKDTPNEDTLDTFNLYLAPTKVPRMETHWYRPQARMLI
jgi:hypothetical protein